MCSSWVKQPADLLRRDNRPHFDGADRGRRYLGRVRDRLVVVLGFDDVEADHLLATRGKGAGLGARRPVAHAHGGRGFRGLYRVAPLEHPFRRQLVVVVAERRLLLLHLRAVGCRHLRFVGVEQIQVFHLFSLCPEVQTGLAWARTCSLVTPSMLCTCLAWFWTAATSFASSSVCWNQPHSHSTRFCIPHLL